MSESVNQDEGPQLVGEFKITEALNLAGHHSTAAVASILRLYADGSLYGHLDISDCSRKVSISLTGHDPDAKANVLHKLSVLKNTVDRLYNFAVVSQMSELTED